MDHSRRPTARAVRSALIVPSHHRREKTHNRPFSRHLAVTDFGLSFSFGFRVVLTT